ncbi:polysaccharide export protein [Puniceicoccales bacterium CK1056]|uniref:Polysaccharide export protein n=1 Tax=Oceanipulchritudo coccoides TaxID=2706888 RepID=A0A6B2M2H8_9BACT|nr:polysaccharide biosynthesis/export family protein [Oceanipulchritudo coccoides]NDV62334.1 polysaccharide export protein [Oceanipulchritudo coccoides]
MKRLEYTVLSRVVLTFLLFLITTGGIAQTAATPLPGIDERGAKFYKLRPGDTVQITVFNEPDLSVLQELDPNGVLIVPLLGRTDLGGLTLREAETRLEETYISEEYLIDPQVTVSVAEFAEQVFYIFGEVNQPGAKKFPRGKQSLDILEAITMAGDLSQYAKRSEIVVRRPIKGSDREEKIIVDLEKVIRGSKRGNEDLITIFPEDIIFVPERMF